MSVYQPISRRPIADMFRKTANLAVTLCCRANVHPDVISYLSIVASAAAAVCLLFAADRPFLLVIAPLFCYLRLWFNMLDGMVAMASGKASWRGEILNDLPDRISDVLVFAAIAHSGLCHLALGYWAAIGALLTAYVGMFGQAVRVQREFSGIMSKPWRMVMVHLGSWATFGVIYSHGQNTLYSGLSILDWTCIGVILGCIQTIWVRLARIFVALKAKQNA